jgi:broad specificity phosphatase PhoE
MRFARFIPLLLLVLLACSSSREATRPSGTTTVYVVRHAETPPTSPDPSLSDQGRERARQLATTLADAGIEVIFTTELARTRQTAEPLAQTLDVPITVRDAGRALADEIRATHAGQAVLVVGHSNTVPQVVEALSGKTIAPIGHDEHDRLYVVTLVEGEPARLEERRYGTTAGVRR